MLDNYTVTGYTADRGLWAAIGFYNTNPSNNYYDGILCKLNSINFNTTKDLATMSCVDVYFTKGTYALNTDTNNNVLTDLTKANTTYKTVGAATTAMIMYHF